MIEYAPFDTKQAEYLKKSFTSWLNVSEGGKRAGKNILNIIAFAESLETHPDKIHLAAGVTKATSLMNIIDSNGFGLEHYFEGRCHTGNYNKMECLYITTRTGVKVVVIAGGQDSDDYRRIKGNSYGSIYITEANECHETFIKEAMDRTISSKRRQIFFDLNPKPPRHWFYTDILDYQDALYAEGDNPGYNFAHFTIWNNLSITTDELRTIIRTYDKTSMWYQADILGRRTAATGRIYTGYKYEDIRITMKELRELQRKRDTKMTRFSIGVDVGGTDATVATLTGFDHDMENVYLVDGYYHKQGKESFMDHARYASEIVDKIDTWVDMFPMVERAHLFAESADKLFRQALTNELKKRGYHSIQVVPSYKKDGIVDRIRLTNILINQGRYHIAKHMTSWFNAVENAMWDDDEYEKGEWVRIDDGSYPVDCLDSSEYAVQPFKPLLLKGA